MTPRPDASTITDDELDGLYARIAELEAETARLRTTCTWPTCLPEDQQQALVAAVVADQLAAPVDDPPVCERRGCEHLIRLHWDPTTRTHGHCATCGCPGPVTTETTPADEGAADRAYWTSRYDQEK